MGLAGLVGKVVIYCHLCEGASDGNGAVFSAWTSKVLMAEGHYHIQGEWLPAMLVLKVMKEEVEQQL